MNNQQSFDELLDREFEHIGADCEVSKHTILTRYNQDIAEARQEAYEDCGSKAGSGDIVRGYAKVRALQAHKIVHKVDQLVAGSGGGKVKREETP